MTKPANTINCLKYQGFYSNAMRMLAAETHLEERHTFDYKVVA